MNLSTSFDSDTAKRLRIVAAMSAIEESTYSLSAKLDYVRGTNEKVRPWLSFLSLSGCIALTRTPVLPLQCTLRCVM